MTLTLTYMEIESTANCSKDYMQVFNGNNIGAPLLGTFCGRSIPAAITSDSAALTVSFTTDSFVEGRGFRAVYTKSSSACGGDFTSEHGAFNSPGYPDNYINNIECVWTIATSPGNQIMVTFR